LAAIAADASAPASARVAAARAMLRIDDRGDDKPAEQDEMMAKALRLLRGLK
jgi:hypothetical protein